MESSSPPSPSRAKALSDAQRPSARAGKPVSEIRSKFGQPAKIAKRFSDIVTGSSHQARANLVSEAVVEPEGGGGMTSGSEDKPSQKSKTEVQKKAKKQAAEVELVTKEKSQMVPLRMNSGTAVMLGMDNSGYKARASTMSSDTETNQRLWEANIALKKQMKNPSKKYMARIIFLFMTLLNFVETFCWMLHVVSDKQLFKSYTMYDNNNQVPQIFAALSAQAVFTHFMIHVEKMYHFPNPEKRDEWMPIKPEPCFAYHPFQNLRKNKPTTLMVKFHFIFHLSTNIFIVVGSAYRDRWINAIESIMAIILSPLIYRFLTLIFTTIRLKHSDLELGKMAEKSYATGLGTFFICLFLGFETAGCFVFEDPVNDDINPECLSSLYGNWMLSYDAVFANISYVILYWLIEHDFALLDLLRLKLGTQLTFGFSLQLLATVVFVFFFSQKKHPLQIIEDTWPYMSSSFFLVWGVSYFVICYKNVQNHEGAGFTDKSRFFSTRNMLKPADPKDHQVQVRAGAASVDLGVKVADELNEEHGKIAKQKSYRKSDTDIALGETTVEDMKTDDNRPGSPAVVRAGGGRSSPSTFNVLPSALRTHRLTDKISKIITSKHLFTLRFILTGQTFAVVVVFFIMIFDYSKKWRYIFEMVKTLSFCSMVVHYSLMIEHKPIYDRNAWLESKPIIGENGEYRFDRMLQMLVSAKLQFFCHNACAFGWPVAGYILGKDDLAMSDAGWGVLNFFVVTFILYKVIRRMCASLRDQVEGAQGQKSQMTKESLFITGFGIMGISYFLTFEVVGCVMKTVIDNDGEDLDDAIEKSCEIYRVANSCTALNLTFMQIMYYLCFSMLTSTEIFTFNMERHTLIGLVLTLIPTYSAAFLFSRREQIEDTVLSEIGMDQPLFWVAIKIGKGWFALFWVLILLLVGWNARPVHKYKFYVKDCHEREEEKNRINRHATIDADGRPISYSPREIERRIEEKTGGGPSDDSSEEENSDSSDAEGDARTEEQKKKKRGKKNWQTLFKKREEAGARGVSAFRMMGISRKTMRVRHERLWILRFFSFVGTVVFTGLQAWNVTEMGDNEEARGYANIAQPLSFACWLMHYFSLFDKKETLFEYAHLILHVFSHAVMPIVINLANDKGWNCLAYFLILFLWIWFAFYCRKLKSKMNEAHQDKIHNFRQLGEIEKTLECFFAECVSAFLVIFYVFLEASGCAEDDHGDDVDVCKPYFSSARIFSTTMSVPLVFYVCTFVADLSTYDVMCGYINRTLKVGLAMVSITALVAVFAFGVRTWKFDDDDVQFFYRETFLDFWEVALLISLITVIRGVLHDFRDQTQMKKELLHRQKAKDMRRGSIGASRRLKFQKYDRASQKRALRKRQLLFADEHGDDDDFEAVEVLKGNGSSVGKEWEIQEKSAVADHEHAHAHYREGRGTRITSNWIGLII
ncbi:hypothetical protein TrST_g6135 [Triparma strigata]|uniref:Transmembrane protein n=1 Tax=Triparma strigata TaxID=1606541 RepID=A0A9W7AVY4_9STRA|nr:hypothetical protein TrST_g6135 [Triparma strigata]